MFENTVHYLSWSDRPALDQAAEEFDSVMLTSHLALAGRGTVPTFVNRLSEDHDVDFYIDPALKQLRAGDHFRDTESGELTPWYSKLVEYHGGPLPDILDRKQNLRFADLSDSETRDLVESVCEFQENFIEDVANEQASKYVTVSDLKPAAIVPWYIKIDGYGDIRTNEEIIEHAQHSTEITLRPCIFVTKRFLKDANARKAIVEMVSDNDIGEVFLWIEGLDNSGETGISDYMNATRLVTRCSEAGVNPYFLYGSYFANLLGYFGLKGTGFGVNHSESKEEKLGGRGGGGGKRYYFDPAKVFLSPPEAVRIAKRRQAPLCGCSICGTTVSSWDDVFELVDEQADLREHYISCRNEQRDHVSATDLEPLLDELQEAFGTYGDLLAGTDSTKDAIHLKKWHVAVREFVKHETDDTLNDYKGGIVSSKKV